MRSGGATQSKLDKTETNERKENKYVIAYVLEKVEFGGLRRLLSKAFLINNAEVKVLFIGISIGLAMTNIKELT